MKKVIIATLLSVLISGCGQKELSPEQLQQVTSLKTELIKTDDDIKNATKQDEMLNGGLIKNLVHTRLEILRTNKALIQQRINAIESGAKVEVVTNAVAPDAKLAGELATELENLSHEISAAKKDAEQYNGGLIGSLKMATIATQEQSQAMLQQRLLSAKYGLSLPSAINSVTPASTSTSQKSVVAQDHEAKEALLPPGSGPLGLQIGLTKKNIEDMTGVELKKVPNSFNIYATGFVPKKNAYFENYGLVISPEVGLCQIRAISKDLNTDSHGLVLKSKVEEISESLTSIYGNRKINDVLLPGSIWKDPRDWMMGLLKEERFFGSEWKGTKAQPLKSDLQSIVIQAMAASGDTGRVYLKYNFKNIDACRKEEEKQKSSSL
ncbi:hypothetical protein [Serratia quinivorans]|uniref:hypothetical protein n=1 Tax=Serratia quinivorans TaxID=137545 RepID=UPI003F9AEF03